jgi:hypothetical protein
MPPHRVISDMKAADAASKRSLAATGSTQADAALIVDKVTSVSGADGTKGVKLPPADPGTVREVYNEHATAGLKIYPNTSDDINDGTVDTAIVIEGKTLAYFRSLDGTTWAAIYTVNT